ncbi:MAG: AbrB/MazE/SpoVT family DNA-binding domain-containing protein [Desulfovibrio sp.]|jgi:bifunctional DNA-binding transcriptional regulator/antitoxin component of YhaV-PrlF toxin-antitoxin module|nr:AbrB/MazE/SpoVT family DNA-binding domain-containing protein [Desulfovibrio sp.]
MLAKVTSKNQLTLPKAIMRQLGDISYFDVQADNGKIILTPVKVNAGDNVREKLRSLGITEDDVADAVAFARQA